MLNWIGRHWCFLFHWRITLPVNNHYVCLHCLRVHPVDWSEQR